MIRQATFVILLGAATALAQDIPDLPEKLKFSPIRFETPRAREYKAKLRIGVPAFVAPNGKEGTPLVRVTVSWRGGSYHASPELRQSFDALYQRLSDPIADLNLRTYADMFSWDEVYAGWARDDLKYYWRRPEVRARTTRRPQVPLV